MVDAMSTDKLRRCTLAFGGPSLLSSIGIENIRPFFKTWFIFSFGRLKVGGADRNGDVRLVANQREVPLSRNLT